MGDGTPIFVASLTSGVDGSSEGGRLSTSRMPSALALYALTLADEVRRRHGAGAEVAPRFREGRWELLVRYQGERPEPLPETWCGHRVVLEEAQADA